MNSRRSFLWVAVAGPVLACALRANAELFEDDKKITTGDIRNITYWRLKWEMERMEEANKERQPEGAIAVRVGGIRRSLESLMKEYPKHLGLKKWYERAGEIEKKIDPNASRQETLREGSLWKESGYEMTYAALNAAKMSIAVKAWEDARDWLKQAHKQLGYLEERLKNQERVANWPPEFVKWIEATRPEVDKLRAEVAAKLK